jgi:hypothetical protein
MNPVFCKIYAAAPRFSGVLPNTKMAEIIKDLIILRNNRFINYQPLSSYMWVLLLVTSFLWVVTFLFVDFQGNYWGYAMVYGIMFIAVTIVVTITNFNDPRKLEWDDLSGSWEAILIKIETDGKGYPDEKQAES